jgi:hypothetical protein
VLFFSSSFPLLFLLPPWLLGLNYRLKEAGHKREKAKEGKQKKRERRKKRGHVILVFVNGAPNGAKGQVLKLKDSELFV